MSKCSDTTPQIPLVLEAETQTTPQYSFSDIELVEEEQEQTTPEYSYSDVEEQELEQPLGLPSNCGEVSYERRKKRLRHSLKECCFCVDLRVGCCFMGLFEMCSSAMCLLFGESNLLLYVGRLGYMVYLIGSAMLTVGALLEWHCLVRIYLFANVVHLLLCPLFILQHAQRTCLYCYYEILFLSLLLILGLYFELVAYSYLVQIQWQHSRFYRPFARTARDGVRRCRRQDIEEKEPSVESQQQSQRPSHVDLIEEPSNYQQSVL
ncbi:uncharacterized protein LOC117590212 isoform X1 [Drosophila guanche]|uniref:Uncharacterized protein n=1 Tax=Drosophila guanche TaxID=7266 RepID=A0A3B0KJG8_DROGU|nr:uncharacterized protein LOC117590212 isoform X1 [Drosophila guanche]SPP88700.1 Hypothetical predicted protein [Drosophila guanche]